ncbi:MAG: helix-turn-helix domain-containing protein [Chloroflexota bacterium]
MDQGLAEYLRALRKKHKMSLRQVERKSGVSNPYIAQIEGGRRRPPSPEILRKLARAYDVSVREMLERAGYLDEPEVMMSEEEKVERAFRYAVEDPDFKVGTRQPPEGLDMETKKYIISVYERVTGKRIL